MCVLVTGDFDTSSLLLMSDAVGDVSCSDVSVFPVLESFTSCSVSEIPENQEFRVVVDGGGDSGAHARARVLNDNLTKLKAKLLSRLIFFATQCDTGAPELYYCGHVSTLLTLALG